MYMSLSLYTYKYINKMYTLINIIYIHIYYKYYIYNIYKCIL